jgi:hypothetical protein
MRIIIGHAGKSEHAAHVGHCRNFSTGRTSVADPDPFDTDPAFHLDTDPDPAFQSVTDPTV